MRVKTGGEMDIRQKGWEDGKEGRKGVGDFAGLVGLVGLITECIEIERKEKCNRKGRHY